MINRRRMLLGLLALPVAPVASAVAKAIEPKPFADGGIVPASTEPVVVGQCHLPLELKQVKSKNVGEITITVNCDTAQLERDLHRIHYRVSRFAYEHMKRRIREFGVF